ncbi:CRISPR-associated protein Cas5t [Candidatus Kryptobacter tengchongensis]|nr:CRISPR-associated protein Cas5t [Candidatus Kryptobacter tengchongensis]CUU09218.1 CRISPR-associated protein Cas5t [Candidatus Kryptobacter tengchongensis]
MEVIRVKISGIVSSFRNPNFVSGVQPTLEVPPPSTVLGLISSACGKIVTPDEVKFGYVFLYESKGQDLELIYELTLKRKYEAKSNVVLREFLTFPELYIYILNSEFERYFLYPEFPLVLGRTQELAKVEEIKKVVLEKSKPVRFGHTVVPFDFKGVGGVLLSLPLYFEYDFERPRVGRQRRPFIIVNKFIQYSHQPIFYDKEKNWGVYFYGTEN